MEYLNYILNIKYYDYLISPIITLFEKKNEFTIENIKDTIKKMNDIKNNIELRITEINKKINLYKINAIEFYKKKNKYLAINNLKLKKIYENENKKLDSIIFNIETYIFQIESLGLMLETANTLKSTSIQINSLNKNLNLSKIEDILEDLNENKEIGNELHNIFVDNSNINMDFDEDELIKELNELENNMEEKSLNAESINKLNLENLPIAPTNKIIRNEKNINKIAIEN